MGLSNGSRPVQKSGMQRKKQLPIGGLIIVFVAILSVLSLFNLNRALTYEITYVKDGFDNNIRIAVETIVSSLEMNRQMYLDGYVSEETSIKAAEKLVRDTRYNSAPDKLNDGYFWADMADGFCVVHYNPENQGTMRWDLQDQEGTYLIRDFITRGNEGGGYTDFYFGKLGDEGGSYLKRGYTLKYEPYGWYISTGNYYEDIDEIITEIERIKRIDFIVTIIASLIISLVGLLIMREHRKMEKSSTHHSELIEITNKVAFALLAPADEESFEKSLIECMGMIGGYMNADRVQIWQNKMTGGILCYTLKYDWTLGSEENDLVPMGTSLQYSAAWKELFLGGGILNGPVSELGPEDREAMESIGLKSTLTIPLYSHGEFWGIACIDDCSRERVFSDDEVNMLTSAGLMLVNSITRHGQSIQLGKMNEKLTDALEQATAANKAKSDFLSTMSHEIRTPMNAILGITDIQLQNENLDEDIQVAFEKISFSGDMLLGIINDILDLSKIEAGKLELIEANYELASLISDTAQLNMMRIGSKQIEFEINVDENLPVQMLGDELRIKQILNNLLSNAFKYTDKGRVTLSVSLDKGKNDDEIMLVISVGDTGQGMSKEQVAKLFDEYARFNMEANRTTEGTGLGMSITRNLTRMMNGEIIIESEPDKGSVFTIRLSQGRVGDDVLGKEMADNLQQFRTSNRLQKHVQLAHEPMPYGKVLIVDDIETNIYVAKGLMTPYGLSIDTAASGYEAIEKVKAGNEYDIIFMDHMMPKMDGIEATQIIRSTGYGHPVVALTANAVVGQADMFIGNGFTDFISKPIDVRQLNTVLNKLIRDKQTPEVIEEAREQAAAKIEQATGATPQPTVDPHFAEVFVRDAAKAFHILDAIVKKKSYSGAEGLRNYVINAHGIKSALAHIGETGLSTAAQKLESAGREGDLETVESKTPEFLSSLQAVIHKLTPREETDTGEHTDEDAALLQEKLLAIKSACAEYDGNTAGVVLSELRETGWPQPAKELLGKISELLLHSEFDDICDCIGQYIEQ